MVSVNRRVVLLGAAAMAGAPSFDRVQAQESRTRFSLPPLPYPPEKNEPYIDAQTMLLHHDHHHAGYLNNLNQAAATEGGDWANKPLQEILANLSQVPDPIRTTVRNNGGGHANHSMFWEIMGGPGGRPGGELAQAIDRDFGGFEKLQATFNETAAKIFGSGWAFVTVSKDGKLALTARPNQDTPLMEAMAVLFGNDVWEHAYYLKYQSRRPDYLKAWWNVVNWDKIAERYAAAKTGHLAI
jgi:superoxide dismutase, Fe-Mn family